MPVGWFIARYTHTPPATRGRLAGQALRQLPLRALAGQVRGDGGEWIEAEALGNHAVVKVRASNATLALIAALDGVQRIPVARLDDPLSSLPNNAKTAIRNKLLAMGYTLAELQARFPGDLGDYTLSDLLRFAVSRRRRVRWTGSAFVADGVELPPADLDAVSRGVTDN